MLVTPGSLEQCLEDRGAVRTDNQGEKSTREKTVILHAVRWKGLQHVRDTGVKKRPMVVASALLHVCGGCVGTWN